LGWDLGLAVEGIGWFGIFCNMLVAVAMVHHQFGFFMNWAGTQKGEGFEFHLLALAMTVFFDDSRRWSSFHRSTVVFLRGLPKPVLEPVMKITP
jgi:hypothetical protein